MGELSEFFAAATFPANAPPRGAVRDISDGNASVPEIFVLNRAENGGFGGALVDENRGYFRFPLLLEAVEHGEREGVVHVVAHVGVEDYSFRSRKRRQSAEKRKRKIGKFGEFHMDDIIGKARFQTTKI